MNREFTIKQGHHDSGSQVSFHFGKKSAIIDVMFDESCLYYDNKGTNNGHWNKLFGWSNSLLPYYWEEGKEWQTGHHRNSVRIGWRVFAGKIELAMYTYQNGKRIIRSLGFVPHSKWLRISMFIREDEFGKRFVVVVNGKDSAISSVNTMDLVDYNVSWGYGLYPYFGGIPTAPHTMKVTIKKVE